MNKTKDSGKRLQGLSYPDDHLVGYDEPTVDSALMDPFYGIFGIGLGLPVGPRDPKGDNS
jgi:hypothetical protein